MGCKQPAPLYSWWLQTSQAARGKQATKAKRYLHMVKRRVMSPGQLQPGTSRQTGQGSPGTTQATVIAAGLRIHSEVGLWGTGYGGTLGLVDQATTTSTMTHHGEADKQCRSK